ncbi:MAG: hypothetical protein AAGI07_04275 [Bacteroidota bacterium]
MFIRFKHSAAIILLSVFTGYQSFSYLHLNEHHHEETQEQSSDHDSDDHSDATECELCKTFLGQDYVGYQKTFVPVFERSFLFEVIHDKVLVEHSEFYANLRAPPFNKV